MKTFKYLTIVIFFLLHGSSCESPEEITSTPTSELIFIEAQFADESISTTRFSPTQEAPYGDTIRIQFPKYFPVGSDKPIDICNMRMRATIPVNVKITPNLTVMDLNVHNTIYVTNSDKTIDKHVIIGEIVP